MCRNARARRKRQIVQNQRVSLPIISVISYKRSLLATPSIVRSFVVSRLPVLPNPYCSLPPEPSFTHYNLHPILPPNSAAAIPIGRLPHTSFVSEWMVRICRGVYDGRLQIKNQSPIKPTPLDRAKNRSVTTGIFLPESVSNFLVCFFCGIIRRRPPAPICNAVFRLAQLVVSCPDVLVDIKRQIESSAAIAWLPRKAE